MAGFWHAGLVRGRVPDMNVGPADGLLSLYSASGLSA